MGESTFEIWLEGLELVAVDVEGVLVVSAPAQTAGWVARRFGRVLEGAANRAGRRLRVADELERKAAESLIPITGVDPGAVRVGLAGCAAAGGDVCERRAAGDPDDASARKSGQERDDFRAGGSHGRSVDRPAYGSAYPSSYTDVYTQAKEVS